MLQFDNLPDDTLVSSARRQAPFPIDAGSMLTSIIRRFWIVALCGLLLLGVGVAASALVAPSFIATAQILVDPIDLNVMQNELTPRLPPSDAGVSIVETEVRVISSDSVLRRVVAKLRLDADHEFFKRSIWRDNGTLERVALFLGAATQEGDADPTLVALENLRRAVSVRRTERTYVIDVVVKTGNPAKAATIANVISEEYLAERFAARFELARRASRELIGPLDELRAAVHVAEEKVVRFREDNNLITANGHLLADQQITELTAQLGVASQRTDEARVRLTQAMGAGRGNRDEYQRALAIQDTLSQSLTALKADSNRTEHALLGLHELESDAQARRSVYEALLRRSRETVEQERLNTSDARVITVAMPARKRSFPPSPLILLPGSLVVGLLCGASLAVLLGTPESRRRVAAGSAVRPQPARRAA